MKTHILAAIVCTLTGSQFASAADNLVCAPPPPFGKSKGGGVAQGWTPFKGTQTIHYCTLDKNAYRIPKDIAILRLTCWSTQMEVVPGAVAPVSYACSSNVKDCGVGFFSNIQRVPSSVPGFDLVCADYTNRTSTNGSVGIKTALPPPTTLQDTSPDK
jgi:hypothetical protein